MGVAFKDLIPSKPTDFAHLKGKVVVFDGYNLLYQFLTGIRGVDGTYLTDSNGNVTSHLVGLFSRTMNFMQRGIKPAFVFDGTPPDLKKKILEARRKIKEAAQQKLEAAKEAGDTEAMRKYAAQTARLTKPMVEEAKKLVTAMGVPCIQAPQEGEAQAAYMVSKGHGDMVGSQDYDSLLHKATFVCRNMSIAGKRKKTSTLEYQTIEPEVISLADTLENLGIKQEQLISLAMLIGTDYNPGGIKGVGPKNAIKLVKQFEKPKELFKEVRWSDYFDYSWEEVRSVITDMEMTDDYDLTWTRPSREALTKILVDDHDFQVARITSTLEKFDKETQKNQQKSLADF